LIITKSYAFCQPPAGS